MHDLFRILILFRLFSEFGLSFASIKDRPSANCHFRNRARRHKVQRIAEKQASLDDATIMTEVAQIQETSTDRSGYEQFE